MRKVYRLFFAHTIKFVLIFSLALGLSGAAEIVICFGEDGHLGIKVKEGDCSDVTEKPSSKHPQSAVPVSSVVAESQCGPCTDIPISNPTSVKYVKIKKKASLRNRLQYAQYIRTTCSDLDNLSSLKVNSNYQLQDFGTQKTLSSIRTTILLT